MQPEIHLPSGRGSGGRCDSLFRPGRDVSQGAASGVVTRASRSGEGLFQKIDVAPAVDFGKIEEVIALILDEETGK